MLFWGNIPGSSFVALFSYIPHPSSLPFFPSLFLTIMELELIDSWMLDKHSTIELYPQSSLNCPCWPWTVNDPPASSSQVTRFIGLHYHTHCLVCSLYFIYLFYCFLPNLLSPGPSLCVACASHFCSHSSLDPAFSWCCLCFCFLFFGLLCFQWLLLVWIQTSCAQNESCHFVSLSILFHDFFLHSSAFFLTWDESWLLAQLPSSLRNSWVYKSVPPHQYLIKMDLSSSVYIMDFVVDVLSPGCCCLVFVRIYL